nr:MAG TPA: hypothetical protein [Bacteriophage sp.]
MENNILYRHKPNLQIKICFYKRIRAVGRNDYF